MRKGIRIGIASLLLVCTAIICVGDWSLLETRLQDKQRNVPAYSNDERLPLPLTVARQCESSSKRASLRCWQSLEEAAAAVRNSYNEVVVTFANVGMWPLADNLVCSWNRLNIENYLVVVLDDGAQQLAERHGVNCIRYRTADVKLANVARKHSATNHNHVVNRNHVGVGGGASVKHRYGAANGHRARNLMSAGKLAVDASFGIFGSRNYVAATHVKPHVSNELLEMGYRVVLSDADIVWLRDPLPNLRSLMGIDSPLASAELDFVMQDDGYMPCTGFYYMDSSPGSRQFMEANLRELHARGDATIDQYVNNDLLSGAFKSRVKYRLLEQAEYPIGRVYFSLQPQAAAGATEPYVVHVNWMTGMWAKVLRLQEAGLWHVRDVDASRYYGHRYVTYTNYGPYLSEQSAPPSLREHRPTTRQLELSALRNAIAIAYVLRRDLVLPLFVCGGMVEGHAEQQWCSLDWLVDGEHFEQLHTGLDGVNVALRPHAFLADPRTPPTVRATQTQYDIVARKMLPTSVAFRSSTVKVASASNRTMCGATESEVRQWFADDAAPLLRFRSLFNSFAGFDDPLDNRRFAALFDKALKGTTLYSQGYYADNSICNWWSN
jgi:Nucleotide-diphospho-sugar transferase